MREIEFRIKDKITKQWFYGMPLSPILEKKDTCIFKSGDGVYFNVFAKVDTLGQYTGLCDKNGTKIFEGDIVKICDKFIDCVIFESGCFIMKRQLIYYEFTYQDSKNIEVVGNIYDNPELLN